MVGSLLLLTALLTAGYSIIQQEEKEMDVGIYLRGSTEPQREFFPSKKEKIETHLNQKGHHIIDVYGEIISKYEIDKPELMRAFEDQKKGKIEALYTDVIDRFGSKREVNVYLKKGLRMCTVEKETDSVKDLIHFRKVLDEQNSVKKDKVRREITINGRVRTNYSKSRFGFVKREPVRERMLVARRICSLYLYDHRASEKIADVLEPINGRKWNGQSILNILKDPIYVEYGVLSQYEYDRIQARLAIKGIRGYKNVLDGRLICSACKNIMKLRSGKYKCECNSIQQDWIETQVEEIVREDLYKKIMKLYPNSMDRLLVFDNRIIARIGFYSGTDSDKMIKSYIPLEMGKKVWVKGNEVQVEGLTLFELSVLLRDHSTYDSSNSHIRYFYT